MRLFLLLLYLCQVEHIVYMDMIEKEERTEIRPEKEKLEFMFRERARERKAHTRRE